MFEGIKDLVTLNAVRNLMQGIHIKLKKRERLTEDEEEILRLQLLGSKEREFRDETHRDRLIDQWWRGERILYKRLKKEEEEQRKKKK